MRVSQALQHALLPRALPEVPRLDFAAEYLPASTGRDVGGDFYDVVPSDATAGSSPSATSAARAPAAAARTGLVRDVLRVLVREGRPLTRAIEMLNDVMLEAGDPLQFCTLAAALVTMREPATRHGTGGTAARPVARRRARAGRAPAPVLVHADRHVELIGRFGTARRARRGLDLHCTRHTLAAGETLLLYTDGVTERRRGDEQFDDERLLGPRLRRAGRPAARLVAPCAPRWTASPPTPTRRHRPARPAAAPPG